MDNLVKLPFNIMKCFPNLQLLVAENMKQLNDLRPFDEDDDSNRLKALKLSNNNINGNWEEARFAWLKHVKFLSLAQNKISTVTCKIFFGLIELVTLDLSHNQIEVFVCGFEFVPSLETLRLDNNKLSTLSIMPEYSKYSRLKNLFLQNNRLETLGLENKIQCKLPARKAFHYKCLNYLNFLENFGYLKLINLSGNKKLSLTESDIFDSKLTCWFLDTLPNNWNILKKNKDLKRFQEEYIDNLIILKQKNVTEYCESNDSDYTLDEEHSDLVFVAESVVIGVLLLLVMILVGILIKKREPKEKENIELEDVYSFTIDPDQKYNEDLSRHPNQPTFEANHLEEDEIYSTL
jgi:Leucine rich repeat